MNCNIKICRNKIEKTDRMVHFLALLLVLYVYLPFFWNILSNVVGLPPIVQFILYFVIIGCVIFYAKRINVYVAIFLIVFFSLLMINMFVVSYPYYVFIEGIQAFVGVAVPTIIVSTKDFDVTVFLDKWLVFARNNIILVLFSIIIFRLNLVNYSIFTGICVPNVFIFAFSLLMKDRWYGKGTILFSMINILIIGLLGGRVAALTTVFMYITAYIFSNNIKIWKKIVFIIAVAIFVVFVYLNFNALLVWINNMLSNLGIRSRSVRLLLAQLQDGTLYVTNRDVIYSKCIEYVNNSWGMPGGFGVVLYLTDGQYYYAHNVILQCLVQFGILGSFLALFVLIIRINAIKGKLSILDKNFIYFLMVSFFVVGMTGSSIWIHYMSTIALAMLFFYKSKNNLKA